MERDVKDQFKLIFFRERGFKWRNVILFFDLFLHIQSPLDRYRDFGDTQYIIIK